MLKRIVFNTAYQVFGKIVISFFGIATTFLLTHSLGELGFSEYSVIFAFVGLFSVIADFGLGPMLTRNMASNSENENHVNEVLTLRIILLFVAYLLTSIFVIFTPYTNEIKLAIIIAYISIFFTQVSSVYWSYFQAKLFFKYIVISQVISSFIFLLFLLFTHFINVSLLLIILMNIVANFCGLLLSIYFSRLKIKLCFNKKILRNLFIKSIPFGLGAIASVAYFKIDGIILSFFYNPSFTPDVGLYALSYKIFEVMIVTSGFFIQTIFPLFSQAHDKNTFFKYFKQYLLLTILLSAASTIFLYIFAEPLVHLLGGSSFNSSVQSLRILSLAAGLNVITGFFITIAIGNFKENLLFKLQMVALVINVFLNIVYIPKYSYIGASWITVITQLFILIATLIVSYKVIINKRNN